MGVPADRPACGRVGARLVVNTVRVCIPQRSDDDHDRYVAIASLDSFCQGASKCCDGFVSAVGADVERGTIGLSAHYEPGAASEE